MTPIIRAGVSTVLTGAALGLVILGGGGRMAMHLIARLTTGTGAFSLGGTVTVVLLGAVSGAIAGLLLFLSRLFFRRWPGIPTLAFWSGVIVLTLRGLHPLDGLRLTLFMPLIVIFLVSLQGVTWRLRRSHPSVV